MKIKEIVTKWSWQILAILFMLLYLGKGCTSKKIAKIDKKIDKTHIELTQTVDSLSSEISNLKKEIITEKEMESIMWKFLELEELSDKQNIPINELKYKDSK